MGRLTTTECTYLPTYLKRNIWTLERGGQINKIKIRKSAAVAPKAQKELDIPNLGAGKLSSVVTKLQRRLNRLEDLRSDGSDWPPPLESRSDDSWGPGPDTGRSCGRSKAPRNDHAPPTRGSAQQSQPMPPGGSGEEERDKWLSEDNRRRRDPFRTPVEPRVPGHVPGPAPQAYGRYGALRDEVSEEDMEWDLEGRNGGPMEDFGISSPRGSASWSRREEEEYMEGVRLGVLGGAYVEEPRHSRLDFEAKMDGGSRGRGTLFDLATGVHGVQARGCRRLGRPEGHQAPHVRCSRGLSHHKVSKPMFTSVYIYFDSTLPAFENCMNVEPQSMLC